MDTLKENKRNEVSNSILDAFSSLRTPQDNVRCASGAKIITLLSDVETVKDAIYVVKRLVRSLGANIPEARIGYFSSLVVLLKHNSSISTIDILQHVKKELHADTSSKSEVGDVALGQILVCGALFRSGRMLECSEDQQKEVIKLLVTASSKKSYLKSTAYFMLLDFVQKLSEDKFANIVWANINHEFKKDIKGHTLDSLYFLMTVKSMFPSKIQMNDLIGSSEIICEDNINEICSKIMCGIDFNLVNHPVYKEIGIIIANSNLLHLFWMGIDAQLTKHNRNRELVAINLLTTVFNNIQNNYEIIPKLITRNFMNLFLDWFKGLKIASKIRNKRDDEDDSKLMITKEKELLNALAKVLKSESVNNKTRMKTIKKLLFDYDMNFGEVTRTNVIKSIISDLDLDSIKKLAKLLNEVLLNQSKKTIKDDLQRPWYNNERLKAAELLSYLVTHDAMKNDIDFKTNYMKLLMCFGFFKTGDNEDVVSNEIAGPIKTCFYRCLTSKFANVDTLLVVLSSLCEFISTKLDNEQLKTKLEKQYSLQNMECWEMLNQICEDIKLKGPKSKMEKVFLILFYQLGLFLFSEPTHVQMAQGSIKELKSCYEHYNNETKSSKPTKTENGVETEEPEWIEVLIEVLLSILSTESSVLRSCVQCVFRLLWEYLTPSAIGQIVSVLDPEVEENPLSKDEDNDSDEESVNDDEVNGKSDSDSDASDSKADEDGDDNDVESDEDEDMKTPEQLKMAVQKALGNIAADSDNDSIDVDLISEEEGQKLDEALAEAFKQFHQGKSNKSKKNRKDKKALCDFRVRVLDLIDIYLEKEPSMDICLEMLAPLTRCLEYCIHDNQFKELEVRVRKTIHTLVKIKKFSSEKNITLPVLCDYLKAALNRGSRSNYMFQALGDVVSQSAVFLIYCCQKLKKNKAIKKDMKSKDTFTEVFIQELGNYFQNRNCLLPIILFHNILQTEWDGSYDLIPIIIDNIFNAKLRQYRRSEGVELLTGFYRFLKRVKPITNKQLSKVESHFEKSLMETISSDNFEGEKKYIALLKKIINTMKAFHESCHIESKLDFTKLLNTVTSCKTAAKENKVPQKQQNGNETFVSKKKKNKRKFKQNGSDRKETGPLTKKVKANLSSEV